VHQASWRGDRQTPILLDGLDLTNTDPERTKRIEDKTEAISMVEEENEAISGVIQKQAEEALSFTGKEKSVQSLPVSQLTP